MPFQLLLSLCCDHREREAYRNQTKVHSRCAIERNEWFRSYHRLASRYNESYFHRAIVVFNHSICCGFFYASINFLIIKLFSNEY